MNINVYKTIFDGIRFVATSDLLLCGDCKPEHFKTWLLENRPNSGDFVGLKLKQSYSSFLFTRLDIYSYSLIQITDIDWGNCIVTLSNGLRYNFEFNCWIQKISDKLKKPEEKDIVIPSSRLIKVIDEFGSSCAKDYFWACQHTVSCEKDFHYWYARQRDCTFKYCKCFDWGYLIFVGSFITLAFMIIDIHQYSNREILISALIQLMFLSEIYWNGFGKPNVNALSSVLMPCSQSRPGRGFRFGLSISVLLFYVYAAVFWGVTLTR